MKKAKNPTCSMCMNELNEEEREYPHTDPADGKPICDSCYQENYEDTCTRCEKNFDTNDANSRPGELVIVMKPVDEMPCGYYRVQHWPVFCGSHLYWDALRFYASMDEKGRQDSVYTAGTLCPNCQKAVEHTERARAGRMIRMHQRLARNKPRANRKA